MEDNYISINWNNSEHYDTYCDYDIFTFDCYDSHAELVVYIMTWIIVYVGLPLTLMAIVGLYFMVRNDHVAPIYVINLLMSDLLQLYCMIKMVTSETFPRIISNILEFSNLVSVGFMVCISLERYLVIAWPLWYRFRRTIKVTVVVCIVVWTLPLVHVLLLYFHVNIYIIRLTLVVYHLLPFPLLIFFLGGTLKALSAARSVSTEEKRQTVAILAVVMLIYTLLYMPRVMWFLVDEAKHNCTINHLTSAFFRLSRLADLILYIFMRKGAIDKILASLCCCRMKNNQHTNNMNIQTADSVSCRQEI